MATTRPAKAILWTVSIALSVIFLVVALKYWNTILFQLMLLAGGSGFLIGRHATGKR